MYISEVEAEFPLRLKKIKNKKRSPQKHSNIFFLPDFCILSGTQECESNSKGSGHLSSTSMHLRGTPRPGCPSSLVCPGSRVLQGSAERRSAVCHLPHFAEPECCDFPHMGWAEPFFPHWELQNPCLVCLFPFPPAESHTWASFTPLRALN